VAAVGIAAATALFAAPLTHADSGDQSAAEQAVIYNLDKIPTR
jgi:hypothetical protein